MGAWVEEGRVHEFDRVGRQGGGQEELPIPPAEMLPPKRGLFGGLFGRS